MSAARLPARSSPTRSRSTSAPTPPFSAGVGENDALERMQIASGLEYMGVKMDEDANNVRGEERVISATDSKVKVLLIPTNEELMIAMDTASLVG